MPRGIYQHHKQDPVERFWRYVDKKDEIECWEWTASLVKGYGSFITKEVRYAHRFSYFLHHPFTDTSCHVRHLCNNPKCVSPYHLAAGTHKDNMEDKVRSGNARGYNTGKKGAQTNTAKLTDEQVTAIRERFKTYRRGDDQRIANEYGVLRKVINDLRNGRTY